MRRRIFFGGPDAKLTRVRLASRSEPGFGVAAEFLERSRLGLRTQQIALPHELERRFFADVFLYALQHDGRVLAPRTQNIGPHREDDTRKTHARIVTPQARHGKASAPETRALKPRFSSCDRRWRSVRAGRRC